MIAIAILPLPDPPRVPMERKIKNYRLCFHRKYWCFLHMQKGGSGRGKPEIFLCPEKFFSKKS